MSFFVESTPKNSEYKMVPAGSHLARCYRIIDLGTQTVEWSGEMKFQRKVMIGWEIHGEDEEGAPLVTDDGRPLSIFKNYTLSWNENATLRKDLQGWRGAAWTDAEASRFDLQSVLDKWCMLNVVHKPGRGQNAGKMFSNVDGITPVPAVIKKQGLPEGANECQIFRLAEPDWDLFETFGKGLKAKIESSPEFKAIKSKPQVQTFKKEESGFDTMEDDMPF